MRRGGLPRRYSCCRASIGHAHSDFVGALRHRVREYAVQSERREEQCEQRERAQKLPLYGRANHDAARQATDLVGLFVQAIHRGPQRFSHADLTNLLHDADDRVPVALAVELSVLEPRANRRTSWEVAIRKGFVDDRHRRLSYRRR